MALVLDSEGGVPDFGQRSNRVLVPAFGTTPDGRSAESRRAKSRVDLTARLRDVRARIAMLNPRSPEYQALAAEADALERQEAAAVPSFGQQFQQFKEAQAPKPSPQLAPEPQDNFPDVGTAAAGQAAWRLAQMAGQVAKGFFEPAARSVLPVSLERKLGIGPAPPMPYLRYDAEGRVLPPIVGIRDLADFLNDLELVGTAMPPTAEGAALVNAAMRELIPQTKLAGRAVGRELAREVTPGPSGLVPGSAGFASGKKVPKKVPGIKPPSPIAAKVAEVAPSPAQAPEAGGPIAPAVRRLSDAEERDLLYLRRDIQEVAEMGPGRKVKPLEARTPEQRLEQIEEATGDLADANEALAEAIRDEADADTLAPLRDAVVQSRDALRIAQRKITPITAKQQAEWRAREDTFSVMYGPTEAEVARAKARLPELRARLAELEAAKAQPPSPIAAEAGRPPGAVAAVPPKVKVVWRIGGKEFEADTYEEAQRLAGIGTAPPIELSTPPPGGGPPGGPPPPTAGAPLSEGEHLPERGFVTHTAESPMGSDVLRKLYDEEPIAYSPITNKDTLERAAARVQADPVAARAAVMAETPLDPDTMVDTMAQGIVLMRRAATEGNVKELRDLSRRIAERLTPSAQAVQLASTIDKLTPEGLFVYIARLIKKAEEKGQGPAVAKRMRAQTQKLVVTEATRDAEADVAKATAAAAEARQATAKVKEATSAAPRGLGQTPRSKGNQRARDLAYLIDDTVREVRAKLTPAERQAIIKAKAILKQSVAEMDEATANDFLDRAIELNELEGQARVDGIMALVEEVRQLPAVKQGVLKGAPLKLAPKLLKQQAADLTQLIDRTARQVFQQLNSVDRLAVARVKAILRRTDVELPQGMAETLLAEARALRGLPQAEQAAALNKLTERIKAFDPVAKELARKKAISDAEARARQMARQAAADLSKLIDPSVKRGGKTVTPEERKAVAGAVAILRRYGVRLPEDKAKDFLAKAKALNTLPEGEQTVARRNLINEINRFDPIALRKSIAEAEERVRKDTLQVARDLEALIGEEPQRATRHITPADRAAIVQAKVVLRKYGARLPNDMAVDFLQKAKALRTLPPEEQLAARQSLINEIKSFDPVKLAMEEAAANRQRIAARKQSAKDLAYLAHEELRVSQARLRNVERDAIRSAKARLKDAGVEMPEELAQSFLDRAHALRGITDEYDQMRAGQSLLRDVQSLLPPSKVTIFLNILGLPRALKVAFDDSFLLRQGIFQAWGDPKVWWNTVKVNVRSLGDEAVATASDRAVLTGPLSKPRLEAGVEWIDRFGALSQREETYMTDLAGKIPGVKQSERGFVTASNKLRADRWDKIVRGWLPEDLRDQTFNTLDELVAATGKSKLDLERLGIWSNVTTGRGNMAAFLKSNNQWLNALFFAPRFAISRVQVPYYATKFFVQNPALRKVVARDLGGFIAGSFTVMAIMDQLPGVDVEWDPRSSDFGDIRVGPLRYNFLAGYAPLVRHVTQFATGQRKSTQTGEIQDVDRIKDVLFGYFLSKLSPSAGEGVTQVQGRDYVGEPVLTWEQRVRSIASQFVPMLASDVVESWQEGGLIAAGAAVPVSGLGGGVKAYPSLPRTWQKDLAPYFALPSTTKEAEAKNVKTRRAYRAANPELNAKLYIAGEVESLETTAARGHVVRLIQENKVNPKEVPGLQEKEFESNERRALRLWILERMDKGRPTWKPKSMFGPTGPNITPGAPGWKPKSMFEAAR